MSEQSIQLLDFVAYLPAGDKYSEGHTARSYTLMDAQLRLQDDYFEKRQIIALLCSEDQGRVWNNMSSSMVSISSLF